MVSRFGSVSNRFGFDTLEPNRCQLLLSHISFFLSFSHSREEKTDSVSNRFGFESWHCWTEPNCCQLLLFLCLCLSHSCEKKTEFGGVRKKPKKLRNCNSSHSYSNSKRYNNIYQIQQKILCGSFLLLLPVLPWTRANTPKKQSQSLCFFFTPVSLSLLLVYTDFMKKHRHTHRKRKIY